MKLTFELRQGESGRLSENEIEIYCDTDGLDLLLKKLTYLKEHGGHIHLMSPSWAGNELTESLQGKDNILINHACFMVAPDE